MISDLPHWDEGISSVDAISILIAMIVPTLCAHRYTQRH
ncbi:hypothetical protein PviCFBP13515_25920 [Pseudomonas viridiflava]|nr:hypothetical protein PviCFBP13507_21575 [Pseudomonas viridiflava]TKK18020.1 hypothetical protein PviCFBP13515_25920 [Pseudomonas viridiflava]